MGIEFRPLPAQARFLASKAKYPAFIAGIGSGKTTIGAIKAILRAQDGDGVIIAPTYPMLRDATQHTLFGLLREGGLDFSFNKVENEARLFGHRILFRTGDNPDRLRGPNLTWAWIDEAAMQKAAVWDITLGRLRVGKPSAWVTGTPSGFNWVHERWTAEDPQYELINSSTVDNTYLPGEYLADLESSYSGEFAQQELHGQFVAFEGLVYSEFRRGVHVVDGELPDSYQRVRAIDFGYTNPFVALWGAIDEDGRLYIYDEHYQRRELIAHHAEQIKARGPVEWTVADHDAQDNAELRQLDIATTRARKDVLAGIQKVKARMIVQQDGRPRLYIHERCVNLLKEIGMYRWKESATKEEPVKENDHAMDALRYMVMQLDGGVTPRITLL
jgi:PBSX family phage terminase large subunit